MELVVAVVQQGLVFLFTFTSTLVILSKLNNRAEEWSGWFGLRSLLENISDKVLEKISGRLDLPDEFSPPRDRLSNETWLRVLQVHMINAAPDRRM